VEGDVEEFGGLPGVPVARPEREARGVNVRDGFVPVAP
jgi:hypothetical protein